MLAEPKEIFSHILNKNITALFDASSISHRLEYIFDFLNGNYSTPILQGTIQKQTLKELKEFYKNPNTDEPIDGNEVMTLVGDGDRLVLHTV